MFIYAVARALWSFGIKAVELVKELAAKDALFCEGVIEVFEWLVNKGKEKYDVNKLLSSMKPEDIIALQKEQNADFEANENYKYFNKFIEALYADLCRVTGKKLKKLSNKKLTETVLAVFGTLEADDVASFDSVALLVDSGKEKKDAVKSVLKIIENYRSALSKSFYSSLNPKEQAGVNAQATVTADMVVDKLLDHPFLKGFFSRTSDNKLVIKSCSNCGSIDSETVNNEDGSVSYICKSCGHPVEVDTSDFSSKEFFDELKSVSADLKSALKKLDDLASVIVCVYDAVKSTPEAVVAILEKRGLLKTSEDTLNHWYAKILLFNSHVKHRRYGKIDKKRAYEQDKFVTAILEANLGETEEVMKKIVEPWQTASKKYERYLKRRAAGDKIMAPFKRLWAKVKEHPLISFVTVITIFAVIAAIFSPATLIDPETGIAMDASYHDKTKEMAAVEAVAETYALDSIAKTHGISDISQIDTRAFDITLDGGASQPESVITISIPLTEYELTAKENVRVFHQGSTSAEYIESRIVGDKVEFKTDHLSVYIVAVVPYKVEFVSGDEVIYEKAKLHGNHIDVPAAELTGHSFICWQATKADGSTVELTPDTKRAYITENVKFTAHYAPESYTLNISSDGISTAGSVILTYGEEYTLPESLLAKTGYTVRKLSIAGVPISSSGVWNIDVDTVPEIQRYIYAPMSANEYKVLFDLNIPNSSGASYNDTVESLECFYDGEYALPKSPIDIDGWKQIGWGLSSGGSDTVYTVGSKIKNLTAKDGGEVVLYAKWAQNNYTIHFDSNKPTGASSEITGTMADMMLTYDADARPLTANAFGLTGWTFQGWATSRDGEVVYSDGASVKNLATDGSITLFAKWQANSYTVNFIGNKPEDAMSELTGSTASMPLTYDEEQALNANGFELPGYRFFKWYTNPECFGISYANEEAVKNLTHVDRAEITLYAAWEECGYTVKFAKNTPADASNPVTGSMPELGLNIAISYDLPACEYQLVGWRFNSWNTSPDGSGTRFADEDTIVSGTYEEGDTVTLYAQWEKNPYTVKFNANKPQGASGSVQGSIADISLLYDGEAGIVPAIDFTLEGWQPLGFSTDPDAKVPEYKSGDEIMNLTAEKGGDITFYTVWQANIYYVKLLPNKPANASSEVTGQIEQNPIFVEYDKEVYLPEYRLTGWVFLGYSRTPDGAVDFPAGEPAKNIITEGTVELYSRWVEYNYYITFNPAIPSGASYTVTGSMISQSMTYDTLASLSMNKYAIGGFTFEGWSKTPNGKVDYTDGEKVINLAQGGTLTLYAVWKVDPMTIAKYVPNGTVVSDTDGENSYTVYNTIGQTPRLTCGGKVIVDWSSCPAGNHNYITAVNSTGTRYGGGSNNLEVLYGVNEVYFIGNLNANYYDVRIVTVDYPVNSSLTIHLKDMNLSAPEGVINSRVAGSYVDVGMYLTIDVLGVNNMSASQNGGSAILNRKNLTFTGSGKLTVRGADGDDANLAGTDGAAGGAAIKAENVHFSMSGQVIAIGGDGGNGARGLDGVSGKTLSTYTKLRSEWDYTWILILGTPVEVKTVYKYDDATDGTDGTRGGSGGNGGLPIVCTSINSSETGSVVLKYGNGGDGAKGGNGGAGGDGKHYNGETTGVKYIIAYDPGMGGNGGNGGAGGDAGISVTGTYSVDFDNVEIIEGTKGTPGSGGAAGAKGTGGLGGTTSFNGTRHEVEKAADGEEGIKGADGGYLDPNGNATDEFIGGVITLPSNSNGPLEVELL